MHGSITYPLTGKLYDIQLGNNIRIKNANMHRTYKGKKRTTSMRYKTPTYMGHGFFFLEFRVFISLLLVSTLEEIHSPKKVLLNKRVQKKKKKEMILSLSSQCANLEHSLILCLLFPDPKHTYIKDHREAGQIPTLLKARRESSYLFKKDCAQALSRRTISLQLGSWL